MSNQWLKGFILFLFVQLAFQMISQAQTKVTGQSVKIINNKKDIYHEKNTLVREEMIKEAVLDAIKHAPEKISVSTQQFQYNSSKDKSYEEVFEEFIAKTLIENNVEWQRTSSYKFARDDTDKKKWICTVEGIITPVKSNSTLPEAPADYKTTSNSLNNFITKKSYNIVYLNAGKNKDVKKGDKFIAYNEKQIKNNTGSYWEPKKKGYIVITRVHKRYSKGKIIKGVFFTHVSQQAAKQDFKTIRVGFEYRFSSNLEQLNKEWDPLTLKDTTAETNSFIHTLYFFRYGMKTHRGFKIGLDIYDTETALTGDEVDSTVKATCFVPKIDFTYAFGLVPDFLYLQPAVSLGYFFTNTTNKQLFYDYKTKMWDFDIVMGADVSLHLRLAQFDIIGGVSYKYLHDYPNLSNYYPHIGISYNLVRYAPDGIDAD